MKTFVDLIERWGIGPFAEAIGVPYSHAQVMKWRNSVHPDHWDAVIADARNRGWNDITAEKLMRLKRGRKALEEMGNEQIQAISAA